MRVLTNQELSIVNGANAEEATFASVVYFTGAIGLAGSVFLQGNPLFWGMVGFIFGSARLAALMADTCVLGNLQKMVCEAPSRLMSQQNDVLALPAPSA